MPQHRVRVVFTTSWDVHDSWSEAYVGVRRLAYEILPESNQKISSEDAALCQLALVGANHLMEVALYKLLRPYAAASGKVASLTEALLDEASYYHMITRWLPTITGKPIALDVQPFLSTERLRRRRNVTIHKSSASATVEMARSALYSTVEGGRALFASVGEAFPYESFLSTYPIQPESWFSDISFP